MKLLTLALLLPLAMPALAFDLATSITRNGDATRLETSSYAKLVLLKQATTVKGSVIASGQLSVTGTANIVMWSRVDDQYYFSKLPLLQNVSDRDRLDFEIPFSAGAKNVTEILIEVEILRAGSVTLSNLKLRGG